MLERAIVVRPWSSRKGAVNQQWDVDRWGTDATANALCALNPP